MIAHADKTAKRVLAQLLANVVTGAPAQPKWSRAAWLQVIAMARRGRVLGFIANVMSQQAALAELPVDIRQTLAMGLMQAAQQQRLWLSRFAAINAPLAAARIDVVPLKGLSLCQTIYRALPLRVMSDLDLLVRERDVPRAIDVLTAAGFATPAPNIHRFHDVIAARRPGGLTGRVTLASPAFSIDLHVRPRYLVARRFVELPIDALWSRVTPCPALGENVALLASLDELTFLVLHALDRADPALAQLLDIALCLRSSALPHAVDSAVLGVMQQPHAAAQTAVREFLRAVRQLFSAPGAQPPTALAPFFAAPRPHFTAPLRFFARTSEMASAERLLYLVGYLFPNPHAYTGRPWQKWLAHTRQVAGRAYARASNIKELQ